MHEKIIAPGEKWQKEPVVKVERVQVQLLVDFGAPHERKLLTWWIVPLGK